MGHTIILYMWNIMNHIKLTNNKKKKAVIVRLIHKHQKLHSYNQLTMCDSII